MRFHVYSYDASFHGFMVTFYDVCGCLTQTHPRPEPLVNGIQTWQSSPRTFTMLLKVLHDNSEIARFVTTYWDELQEVRAINRAMSVGTDAVWVYHRSAYNGRTTFMSKYKEWRWLATSKVQTAVIKGSSGGDTLLVLEVDPQVKRIDVNALLPQDDDYMYTKEQEVLLQSGLCFTKKTRAPGSYYMHVSVRDSDEE